IAENEELLGRGALLRESDYGVPAVQSLRHRRANAEIAPPRLGERRKSGLDFLRRPDRVLSVVLSGEGRHHGVAEDVHHGAIVRLDRVGHQGHEFAHAREDDCRIEHVRHAREPAHLREQDHQRRAFGLVRFANRHVVLSLSVRVQPPPRVYAYYSNVISSSRRAEYNFFIPVRSTGILKFSTQDRKRAIAAPGRSGPPPRRRSKWLFA